MSREIGKSKQVLIDDAIQAIKSASGVDSWSTNNGGVHIMIESEAGIKADYWPTSGKWICRNNDSSCIGSPVDMLESIGCVFNPVGPSFQEKKAQLADWYLDIIACKDCQSPVNRGHCCRFCGSAEPY